MSDVALSVAEQVARSAARSGPSFDSVSLALTLTLYRTFSEFDRVHAEELGPVGLTVSQFNVLNVLDRASKPMTMGELSAAVSVRPANMTGVVDAVSDKGLVERRLNPSDRRSFLVAITPDGESFLADFLPGHWQYLDGLLNGLRPAERAQLLRLLDKLLLSLAASGGPDASLPAPAPRRRAAGQRRKVAKVS